MYATKIPSDERSLVLRLIEGEEDAFCELYAAYKNRLIYSLIPQHFSLTLFIIS